VLLRLGWVIGGGLLSGKKHIDTHILQHAMLALAKKGLFGLC